ncbi:MAG: DUF4910 domain-containing protein [Rhodothermales bacterium]|nr:DUF4910 domain-containing protein [Rhodothermales bacterium]
MHDFATRLFPIHRSITGAGVRETLSLISDWLPLDVHEVPTGTPVLDWTVPPEWKIREAYIADESGTRIVDLANSTLHVEAYSDPVDVKLPWSELRTRIHTLPDRPAWIPYRTSYYKPGWSFCMAHNQYVRLEAEPDRRYRVRIDSEHREGSLTYAEAVLPGSSTDECLVWTHVCHPSLANDNLSGIAVATWLALGLAEVHTRLTYRFVFAPATIGAIAWLERNRENLKSVRHGLVLSGVGDAGPLTYKSTRKGNAPVDRAAAHVLSHLPTPGGLRSFEPFGYDERQFCSPGFDLPVGCLTRSPGGTYPEYHTSADNLDFLKADALEESLAAAQRIVEVLEGDGIYRNTKPHGEPRLDRLGLYQQFEHGRDRELLLRAVLWTLNLSDGHHSLLDVADRSGLPFEVVRAAADALLAPGLLLEI